MLPCLQTLSKVAVVKGLMIRKVLTSQQHTSSPILISFKVSKSINHFDSFVKKFCLKIRFFLTILIKAKFQVQISQSVKTL